MSPIEEFRFQLRDIQVRLANLEAKVSEVTYINNTIRQELLTIVPLVEKLDRESDLEARLETSLKTRERREWTKRDRFIALCVALIAATTFLEQTYTTIFK